MNELVYKKILALWNFLQKFFSDSQMTYILAIWTVFSFLIFFNVTSSLRSLLVISILIVLLLYLRFKNWFVCFFLVTIFVLPFFVPNKYYIVEVIRGSDIALPEFREGYYLGYGVNVSNIFLVFTLFFALKEVFAHPTRARHYLNKNEGMILSLLSFLVFFVIAAYSSLTLSFSPIASMMWLFQYLQIGALAWAGWLYQQFFRQQRILFYTTLVVVLLFQVVVVTGQFLNQAKIGLAVEYTQGTVFNLGIDENNAIPRPAGTFSFHNQLGFVALLLFILVMHEWLRTPNPIFFLGLSSALYLMVLAQGRAVWGALLLITVVLYFMYKTKLKKRLSRIPKRYLAYGLVLAFLASFVIIPRVWLSMNARYEGSGLTLRWKMIQEGMDALRLQPFFGYGVGTNEYILFSLFPNGVMSVFPAAIHLGFLQLALEVGWAGLFFFLLPFAVSGRNLTKEVKFVYLSTVISCSVYYGLQPHVGIIEFAYLGLILSVIWSSRGHQISSLHS